MISQISRKSGWLPALMTILLCGAALLTACHSSPPSSQESIDAAAPAADAWLPVLDAGHYDQSYDGFCAMAKSVVSQEAWAKQIERNRGPLGPVSSRNPISKSYVERLENGTPGPFVIIHYETDFQAGKRMEAVTLMQDKDGSWRIAGYVIRPLS